MAEETKQSRGRGKHNQNLPSNMALGNPMPMLSATPQITVATSPQEFKQWLEDIYNVDALPDEELLSSFELLRYKGFDRKMVLEQLYLKIQDRKLAQQAILVCALQGPVRACKVKLSNGKSLNDMGIVASGVQGTQSISCQRITASTADLAAYFLKRLNVPKRLSHNCPAWLQFPSAGAITMPDQIRADHVDFSKKFSGMIGGSFNDQIYNTMVVNSYLDPKLRLFA